MRTERRPIWRLVIRTAVTCLILATSGLIADLRAEGRTGNAEHDTQTETETPSVPSTGGAAESLDFAGGAASRSLVQAVPTFASIGLYWKPDISAEARDCAVRYRPVGTETWRQGLPLWYDARDQECRGSLVHLTPDTAYEIELLEPAAKMLARVRARTWSENFPIGKTVTLPEFSDETLTIDESGSPDGYVLVAPRPGAAATIDVGGRAASNIVIAGSYVIVRGLRLLNAGRSAIVLDKNVHDVVIEENDISGWGRVSPDGWGMDMDAAIYSDYSDKAPLERVIIQRNKMHHPRAGANAWDEYRKEYNSGHPLGPQAIFLWNSGGNHVIRYNEVYSDDTHKFNDCIGGGENFSKRGFPHRDSDIYGNKLSQCWDDAIESEGGNANVRIWGNYIDMSYVMIAVAATEIGPVYIWRNVADRSRQSGRVEMAEARRGVFLKTQSKEVGGRDDKGEREYFGDGRIYVFHNTLLQREGENEGVFSGLSDLSGRMSNVTSRNNILHVNDDQRPSIADKQRDPSNDFDFDLYNGRLNIRPEQEPNGVQGIPAYIGRAGEGPWALDPSSPGFDAGVVLPNFSDGFSGAAPDMGAQEAGAAPLQFGVDAYR